MKRNTVLISLDDFSPEAFEREPDKSALAHLEPIPAAGMGAAACFFSWFFWIFLVFFNWSF